MKGLNSQNGLIVKDVRGGFNKKTLWFSAV